MNAFDRNLSTLTPVRPASVAWAEALSATAEIDRHPGRVLYDYLAHVSARTPDAPALLSDGVSFTFSELVSKAEACRNWAHVQGLGKGDCVALIMSNRPEYVAIWLGLSSAGVVTALINTGLTGKSLLHCLSVAKPRHVIAEDVFLRTVETLIPELGSARLWDHSALFSTETAAHSRVPLHIDETALLIYTSGTTGLPKAARVSHRRVLNWALWFKGLLGNTAADRMYDCLPLYHSVGGIVAVAATLVAGGSTVVAPKFSARRFWSDIRRWNCTQFQYIGELCRYLVNAPRDEEETNHTLRVVCGNGLRADVWESFQSRFAIPQIIEFYAATEGSFSLFNAEGKAGSIGRVPSFLRHRFPTAIVRFDPETGQPARGDDGFCIRVEADEPGEAIGRIGDGSNGTGRFEGYTDSSESERKILRNVFKPGDSWFRTGDLMRVDTSGYYYFVDRVGDTYRWKGENVSTLEVANALSACRGVLDITVYGISVPGADGKAGIAFLQTAEGFSLEDFHHEACRRLPSYAIPLFVRIGRALAVTETFKHRKHELVREGFDQRGMEDAIFVRLPGSARYTPLDSATYEDIVSGRVRF